MHKDSLNTGYEVSDISPRLVWIILAGVFISIVVGIATIVAVMRAFEARDYATAVQSSPLDRPDSQEVPAGLPRLQGMEDIGANRIHIESAAQAHLEEYGWVSETEGMRRVHVPIDTAIDLVAEGTVPYRQAPPAPEGETADSES